MARKKQNITKTSVRNLLKQFSAKTLREYSKSTKLINYQGESTKAGILRALQKIDPNTHKGKRQLKDLYNLATFYNQVDKQGDEYLLDTYYASGNEAIKQFIRIKRDYQGWETWEILQTIEMYYDTIVAMDNSDPMLRMEAPDPDQVAEYFEGE